MSLVRQHTPAAAACADTAVEYVQTVVEQAGCCNVNLSALLLLCPSASSDRRLHRLQKAADNRQLCTLPMCKLLSFSESTWLKHAGAAGILIPSQLAGKASLRCFDTQQQQQQLVYSSHTPVRCSKRPTTAHLCTLHAVAWLHKALVPRHRSVYGMIVYSSCHDCRLL